MPPWPGIEEGTYGPLLVFPACYPLLLFPFEHVVIDILVTYRDGVSINKLIAVPRHEIQGINHGVEFQQSIIFISQLGVFGFPKFVSLAKINFNGDFGAEEFGGAHNLDILYIDVFEGDIIDGLAKADLTEESDE